MLRVSLFIVLAGMIAACDSSEEACAPFSGVDEAFQFTATIDGQEQDAVADAQLRVNPIPEEGDATNPDDVIWTLSIRVQFAYPLERGEACPPSERCESLWLDLQSFSEFCAGESYELRGDQAPAPPRVFYTTTEDGESTTYRTPLDGAAGQVTLDALDAERGVVGGTFEAPLFLLSDAEERIDVEGSFRSPLEFLQD